MWSIKVHLTLLKTVAVGVVVVLVGMVSKVLFMSKPTTIDVVLWFGLGYDS